MIATLDGIIIKNGIVLIDKIDLERNAGADPYSSKDTEIGCN